MVIAFALTIYFLALILLAQLKSVSVPGRVVYFFRSFLPSWKFFEDVGYIPILYYRVSSAGPDTRTDLEAKAWSPYPTKLKRRWYHLFFNPQGNFLLAKNSLLQQFLADLQERPDDQLDALEESSLYLIAKNLVIQEIRQSERGLKDCSYQFKLCVFIPGREVAEIDDILISPVYQLRWQKIGFVSAIPAV